MYHEVLHGYLNYERSRIGETEFNNRYPAMESYDVKFGDGTTMKKVFIYWNRPKSQQNGTIY